MVFREEQATPPSIIEASVVFEPASHETARSTTYEKLGSAGVLRPKKPKGYGKRGGDLFSRKKWKVACCRMFFWDFQ